MPWLTPRPEACLLSSRISAELTSVTYFGGSMETLLEENKDSADWSRGPRSQANVAVCRDGGAQDTQMSQQSFLFSSECLVFL
jgi:hypothetical protein